MKLRMHGLIILGLATVSLLTLMVYAGMTSNLPGEEGKLRIIVFGAHPDDCELKVGGMAAIWAAKGHLVKFVSTTNGDIGHARMAGGQLAKRRTAEVKKAAQILGIESEVLDIHDGELMPTLENRRTIVRLIREWKADIVISHRTNDYHPDHRYTGVLVQDAAFMVTVKFFCPDVPQLTKNPVFLHMSDDFQKPLPFAPDIVVPIDSSFAKKVEAVWSFESQIESFWAGDDFDTVVPVPKDPEERKKRYQNVHDLLVQLDGSTANKYRDRLIALYGEEIGKKTNYAEAFEVTEYGKQPKPEELKELFPFR